MRIYLITLLFINSFIGLGQEKKEKEEQINLKDLPLEIIDTIRPFLTKAQKIRYYLETDGDQKSYEVKFHLKDLNYSIEFGENAELEDVEVLVDLKSIEQEIQQNIRDHLEKYDKSLISRVQKQFSSDTATASYVIEQALNDTDLVTVRYEVVSDLRKDNEWTREELLFDVQGLFLSSRRVTDRIEDFILYR